VNCTNLVIGRRPPRLQIHDDPNHDLAEPAIADVTLDQDQDNDAGIRWQHQPDADNDSAMNESDAATEIENNNLEADVVDAGPRSRELRHAMVLEVYTAYFCFDI
jgi:hypothetical protein